MNFKLPKNFQAAGVAAGIKKSGVEDLALLVSTTSAVVAGTFTTNKVKAASVKLCMERLKTERGYGVVVNSGCANACTGKQGMKDAIRMTEILADGIEVSPDQVFVCSTGHIGDFLPMDVVEKGIGDGVKALSRESGAVAAKAIMTTDTVPKTACQECVIDGHTVCVSGMTKGAGMIEPNMATMLGFIMTDAAVEKNALQSALKTAVDKSFNRISVDGDMSTNDTVLCFANGVAGNQVLNPDHPQWTVFCQVLNEITFDLAMQIVGDGEGAKKIVSVMVKGAADDADADKAARAIANSLLVKTSWVGKDANWGRIMDTLGYSGVEMQESSVDIHYNGLPAVLGGLAADTPIGELESIVEANRFEILINLHMGIGETVIYTCECTEEYVRINV